MGIQPRCSGLRIQGTASSPPSTAPQCYGPARGASILPRGMYAASAMDQGRAEGAVRAAIEAKGRITFAEFMELALYGPGGYYVVGGEAARIGAAGDFFTSPHAHPAFGALIAVQLEQMWRAAGMPRAVRRRRGRRGGWTAGPRRDRFRFGAGRRFRRRDRVPGSRGPAFRVSLRRRGLPAEQRALRRLPPSIASGWLGGSSEKST